MKKSRNTGLGLVSFVLLCLVAGALAAAWFKVVQPFMLDQKIKLADHKFEFNKFSEAKQIYETLLPKAPPAQKRLISDRIAQLPLAEKNLMEPAPKNTSFNFGALDALSSKIGLLFIRFRIQNLGKSSIPIRRSLFYLKSLTGKCEVALDRPQNIEVGVVEGDLFPGEEMEGAICVKFMMTGDETLYLVYNNGELYLNRKIPPSRIWAQTSGEEFDKPGWKGTKASSKGRPGGQSVRVKKTPAPAKKPVTVKKAPAISKKPQRMASLPKKEAQPAKTTPAKTRKPAVKSTPPKAKKPAKKSLPPGYYRDPRHGFRIKVPNGWKKLNTASTPSNSFSRLMPSMVAFRGPEWKGNFPLLIIQKVSNPYMTGLTIDSQAIYAMEKDIRKFIGRKVEIRKLKGRPTLIGNTKVGEIDLEFEYEGNRFHMRSFVLEGSSGYLLSFMALENDFNASANAATQAIRTFRTK